MPIDPGIYALQRPVPFNNPFERLREVQEHQQRSQLNQQAINSNQALEEQRRAQIAAQERKQAEEEQYRQALIQTAGQPYEQVRQAVAQSSPQHLAQLDEQYDKHQTAADAARKAQADYAKAMQAYVGTAADQLIQAKGDPTASNLVFDLAVQNFPELKPHVEKLRQIGITQGRDPMLAAVQSLVSPEAQKTRADIEKDQRVPDYTLNPGDVRHSGATNQVVATGPEKPLDHSAQYKEWQDYKTGGGTLDFPAYQNMDANRHKPVSITNAATDDKMIDEAARNVLANPRDLTSIKNISSLRGDQRMKLFNKIKELDPTFNAGNIDRQIKFLDSYEDPKGRAATNRGSMNNILQHAADLNDVNDDYKRTDFRFVNIPIAALSRQGGTAWQKFETPLAVLKDEIGLYFAGGYAPSGEQLKMWNRIVNDTATPAQVVQFSKDLAHAGLRRADTHNEQFKTVMGYDDPNLITPQAVEAAKKLGMSDEVSKYGSGGRLGTKPSAPLRRPIPGIPGGEAESTDGGKTWKRVK